MKAGGRMTGVRSPWVSRIIPSKDAVATSSLAAEDGHELRADLYGRGAAFGEPHRLTVTCEPLQFDDGEPGRERWPTLLEMLGAADALAPGAVLTFTFVANPRGVERVDVPPGTVRSLEAAQVGQLAGTGQVEIVAS